MSALIGLVTFALHLALVGAMAPLAIGLARLVKARMLGRRGAALEQPWRDLLRLLRKEPVLAENASVLFAAAPYAVFAATAAAAALVPSFALGMTTAPAADLLVIAGLLALARVTLALAGMDVGTAFGGIGASREMTFSVFAEPALMLVFLTFALLANTTNLDVAAELVRAGGLGLRVSLGLTLVAMLVVALAENGRVPVDNPATHLELTMVHEAMALEYSGRHLALLDYAAALRLVVWVGLVGAMFLPFGMAPAGAGPVAWLVGMFAWVVKLVVACLAIGVMEASLAKMRIFRVPEFLGVAVLLGLLAALYLFVSTGFA
jgi:formate hydrogenlyase subunit 4